MTLQNVGVRRAYVEASVATYLALTLTMLARLA